MTYGQHESPERDLARHGRVGPDTAAGEQRHQHRHYGNAGAGPVLPHRTGREVDVQVRVVKDGILDTQLQGRKWYIFQSMFTLHIN